MSTIKRKDFIWALKQLRSVRARANKRKTDPWAFRQALITVLELDTETALRTGITREQLEAFDNMAGVHVQKFLESIPP